MEENKAAEVIDLRVIIKKIYARRTLFLKVWPIAFVVACIYIFSLPRYYRSSLSLAPEIGGNSMQGTLGSLASSFGLDIGAMETSDAINPMLYPDLMEDNGFVVSLFSIKVKSSDGEIDANYYDYLTKYNKRAWWSAPIGWVKKLFAEKPKKVVGKQENDPYILSKRQDDIANVIRENISINVDKKTAVITISTKAQDALVAKTLADSVKSRLQRFITNYRTNKSRIDEQYYKQLVTEAKQEYVRARQLYGNYADANMEVTLESFRAKQEDLENEMQLKYNTYTTLMAQYQAARAKVQERTPAFTLVKGAAVPIKPAGPKRMLFVLGMLFLATFATIFYILKDDLKRMIMSPKQ